MGVSVAAAKTTTPSTYIAPMKVSPLRLGVSLPVNWKVIIGQAFLLVAALALGITVGRSTPVKVVLFERSTTTIRGEAAEAVHVTSLLMRILDRVEVAQRGNSQ